MMMMTMDLMVHRWWTWVGPLTVSCHLQHIKSYFSVQRIIHTGPPPPPRLAPLAAKEQGIIMKKDIVTDNVVGRKDVSLIS
jgi:hypothetical protein